MATAKELMNRLAEHHPESGLDSIQGAFYALAMELSLKPNNMMENLKNALGMVYQDIGKLFVSPQILNQSEPLTLSQKEEIQSHVPRGFDLLKEYNNDFLTELVGPAILEHHMDWKQGLGDQTLYGSTIRILDVLGAMTSGYRYYGDRKSITTAINEMEKLGGEKHNLLILGKLTPQAACLIDSCPSSLIKPEY